MAPFRRRWFCPDKALAPLRRFIRLRPLQRRHRKESLAALLAPRRPGGLALLPTRAKPRERFRLSLPESRLPILNNRPANGYAETGALAVL